MIADNGTEFSKHQQNAKAQEMAIFFARPYHSWEGGLSKTPKDWSVKASLKELISINTSIWYRT